MGTLVRFVKKKSQNCDPTFGWVYSLRYANTRKLRLISKAETGLLSFIEELLSF